MMPPNTMAAVAALGLSWRTCQLLIAPAFGSAAATPAVAEASISAQSNSHESWYGTMPPTKTTTSSRMIRRVGLGTRVPAGVEEARQLRQLGFLVPKRDNQGVERDNKSAKRDKEGVKSTTNPGKIRRVTRTPPHGSAGERTTTRDGSISSSTVTRRNTNNATRKTTVTYNKATVTGASTASAKSNIPRVAFFPGGGRGCSPSVPYLACVATCGEDKVGNPGGISSRDRTSRRPPSVATDSEPDSEGADGIAAVAVNRNAFSFPLISGMRGGGPGGYRWFTGYSDTEEEDEEDEEEEDADCATDYEMDSEVDRLSEDEEGMTEADCEDDDKNGEF